MEDVLGNPLLCRIGLLAIAICDSEMEQNSAIARWQLKAHRVLH